MHLDRRTFLQWTAAAGLAVQLVPPAAKRARAADPGEGLLFLTVHCGGGWDPTLLCDPKGAAYDGDPDAMNRYLADDVVEVGPFRLAPVDGHEAFFRRFQDRLLVINGIDTQTNSHETGTRYTWSGSMDPGFPAFAALAAARGDTPPTLAYLAHGGYTMTDGVVPPTRMPDTSAVREIAFPERLDPRYAETTILPPDLMTRLREARAARLERQLAAATLPRVQRSMAGLRAARAGDNELARLAEVLPDAVDDRNNPLIRQGQVTLACFEAGVTRTASLEIGGFDTHGDHDTQHTPRMRQVIEGLGWILDEAERRGLTDRLVVLVGSDFGRTPWYNDTNGKDHWPITSLLALGPGIRGGRVVGGTDDGQVSVPVDPTTLAPSDDGIRITPAHVHGALRRLAGLEGTDLDGAYGVGEPLALFG